MKKFKIEHIDPLGQGVYKESGNIYFIPKTLPSEEGLFKIVKKSKGVNFCQMVELTTKSPQRISAACPHFDSCPACQYLHMDYATEIKLKAEHFIRMLDRLQKIEFNDLHIIESPNRLKYRNRVQLHYDTKRNSIGVKQYKSNQILAIPECKILDHSLRESFNEINKNWKRILPKGSPTQGHVEIYNLNEKVNISWNQAYAHGGFSQVNAEVNQKIQTRLIHFFDQLPPSNKTSLLDLFGGSGNFSEPLTAGNKLSIDIYPDEKRNERFFHLDLFDKNALQEFLISHPTQSYEVFIVDPPRSGFKDLAQWVSHFHPTYIVYISCHSATMVRDLLQIKDEYQILENVMADLFPATAHFEGMTLLKKI